MKASSFIILLACLGSVTASAAVLQPGADVAAAVAAASAGSTVELAAGYFELQDGIVLDKGVTLKGAGRDQTVLYKSGTGAVTWRLVLMNDANALVKDLTISNGCVSAGTGAGVQIDANGGTLENCRVQKCWATTWDNQGPCVYVNSANGLVSRCIIEAGYKQQQGSHFGLGARLTSGVIENSLIRNCTYTGSNSKGTLYLSGTAVARNCTVVGNSLHYYGGIYCDKNARAINCVVLDNKAPNDTSAGAPNWAGTAANFINCAILPKANETCYDGAPDFLDKVDYRLLPSSHLRNAGDVAQVSGIGALDLDGNPRVVNGQIDIGCYQFDVTQKAIGLEVVPAAAVAGTSFVFTPFIEGYSNAATHRWFIRDAANVETEVPVADESGYAINTPGIYEVRLEVTDGAAPESYSRSEYLYVAPAKIYVDSTAGAGTPPFGTSATKTKNLNEAVRFSQMLAGQEIEVADGTYNLTGSLEFNVATTMRSVNGAGSTIIHGKTYRPIRLNNANAKVSGFTITGGSPGEKGGGVFIDYNGGELTESIVTGNSSQLHDSQGGGIYMRSDNAHVDRCVVCNNTATKPGTANGGGVCMEKGLLENCLITNNTVNWNGGGLYISGGKAYNCTVYGNKANNKQGGGIYASGGSVVNCAAYGNTALNDTSACAPEAAGTATCYTYCAFPKSLNGMTAIADPGFVDAAKGDFHLSAGSGLRDAGSVLADLGDKDLDGADRRSLASNPDIGCYEYDKSQKALGLNVSPLVGYEGTSFSFTPTIEGYGAGATHSWKIVDKNGNEFTVTSAQEASYAVATGGVYSITLSVTDNDETDEYSLADAFRVVKRVQTVSTVAALDSAVEDANAIDDVEITVAPGTYILTHGIELYKNTRLVSSGGAEVTVLKREGGSSGTAFRILKIDHADAFVQGFTLTGGYATDGYWGGGCYLGPNGGTLVDCVVCGNHLNWYDNGGAGIGMKKGLVDRCVITNNVLDSNLYYVYGGGVRMDGGTLRNSLIANNRAHKSGGGVYISGGKMIGCTVYGNTAVMVSGNWAGGGIYVAGGEVLNCASYGNHGEYDTSAGAPDVAGEYANCYTSAFPKAVGTLTAIPDPLFTDAANGDFTLATGSSLIDAGAVRDDIGDKDLARNDRCSSESAPDIGCYEYEKGQIGIGFTVLPSEGFGNTAFVFTPTIEGAQGQVVKTWTIIAENESETELPADCEEGTTISSFGTFSVKLTVTTGGRDYELVRENVLRIVPHTMFVDVASANPVAPYATRETASTNIHDTIAYAIDGSTIQVAPGEYEFQSALELDKDISLVSEAGYAATVLKRTFGTAAPQFGLVRMHSPNALVKGFTITGGYGKWGGVYIDTRGGTLEDSCVVSNRCSVMQSYNDGAAGGCYSKSSKGVWRRCIVKSNATYWTAAGGIHGGIADNCLVAENYALGTQNANGGGMCVASATNCTVVSNYSYNRVAGMTADAAYNCIMLGNVMTNSQSVASDSDWENDVSIRDRYKFCCTSTRTGDGYAISTMEEIGFKNAAAGNYRITRDSPALNLGDCLNYTAESVDLDGRPRIFRFGGRNSRPDAGCYEHQGNKMPEMMLMLR